MSVWHGSATRAARMLGVTLPVFIDFERAKAVLEAGDGLPAWADTYEIEPYGEEGVIGLDGTHGLVRLGASIVYGEYASCTSRGPNLYIGCACVAEEVSAEYLRELAADLLKAADAVEGSARVIRRRRGVDEEHLAMSND